MEKSPPPQTAEGTIELLKDRIRVLEKTAREGNKDDARAALLASAIVENVVSRPIVPPSKYRAKKHSPEFKGAILDIGDTHYGEPVSLRNTGGLFEYDSEICAKRLDYTFDEAIEIAKDHKIGGLTLILGGDLVSGAIHEDLNRHNEMMMAEQVVSFSELAYGGIEKLLSAGLQVDVVGVSGNHGRIYNRDKPYFKNKQQENLDWLIMKFLEQYGRNQKGLDITIPDTIYAVVEVAKRRFHVLHGDTIKFQKSMGISFYAIEKEFRRLKTMVTDGTTPPFNDVISHHLHQQFAVPIGNSMWYNNGSIKGPDEYGGVAGLRPPEQAQQQMLIVEEGKVRAHYPIVSEHIKS